jgi:hypothetical protein
MRAFVARHGLFVALLAVLLPVYWWQMQFGVDVSDEGYYAVLPASWLRSSPADTGNMSPHQLSAAVYYPLVKGYSLVHPDLGGLILFLRRCYLGGSLLTCLAAYRFFSRVASPAVAAASAACLFVYIPLGLPAVSYNTLALFGLASGLCTLGRALFDREQTGKGGGVALVVSSALLGVGGCAYPSVAPLAPLALAALFWLFPTQRRYLLAAFGGWVLWTGGLLAVIVAHLGGVDRFAEVIDFTRKLYSGSVGEKVGMAKEALTGKGQLWLPCLLLFVFGVARRVWTAPAVRPLHLIACAAVAGWWLTGDRPTGLFTKGHDVVFMLCVGFVPLLPLPRRGSPAADKLLAVLFLSGVVGGGLVASSAVAGLVNFPVLGILAVCSGLALSSRGDGKAELIPAGAFGVVACVAWATLTHVYAEPPLPSPAQQLSAYHAQVTHGPYAGLRTQPWKIDLLDTVEAQLRPFEPRCRTADFWMSSSGLYLLTPFELRTPMPYWLEDVKTTHLHDTLARHYAVERNRPDLVVLWTMTQQQDKGVDREQLRLLAEHYTEQPAKFPLRIFLRNHLVR